VAFVSAAHDSEEIRQTRLNVQQSWRCAGVGCDERSEGFGGIQGLSGREPQTKLSAALCIAVLGDDRGHLGHW